MSAETRNISDADDDDEGTPLPAAARRTNRAWRGLMGWLGRFGIHYRFTTISGRILTLNLVSLIVLVVGLLYLNDFRAGLIDARIKSLEVQTDIIARSIAQDSTLDGATEAANDPLAAVQKSDDIPQYRISPEKSAQLLRSLIEPTQTHGFIYNADGDWLVDSNKIYSRGELRRFSQQSTRQKVEPGYFYWIWLRVEQYLRGESLPEFKASSPFGGKALAEVKSALEQGNVTPMVRVNEQGETILTVAAPIYRGGPVLGALLLTTAGGEIDGILAKERLSIMQLWGLVLVVTVVFSLLLAGTIVGPMHRLAVAAESVRKNIRKREEIPDFTHRSDEIGNLSAALRDMTAALYKRLDAIESFAADVAHELKNPLTSLRSAADTMSIVKKEEDRDRLVQIIQHDVQRLNRLITDISDASRLDAELARERRRPVNVARLLDSMCGVVNDIHREGVPKIELQILGMPRGAAISGKSAFVITGHESRLSQVINNLLDNAISFSPPNGRIFVTCRHIKRPSEVEITVEDEGPGIRPENLERIFERFYTDRPDEFGQNSGLGLNISRQIIAAHGGRIWAENHVDSAKKPGSAELPILGARFVIRLPGLS